MSDSSSDSNFYYYIMENTKIGPYESLTCFNDRARIIITDNENCSRFLSSNNVFYGEIIVL